MTLMSDTCSECNADVVRTSDGALLDLPAVAYDPAAASWVIVPVADGYVAADWASVRGDYTPPDRAHTRHTHQRDAAPG